MAELMRKFFEASDTVVLIVSAVYFIAVAIGGYFCIWKDDKNDKKR